VDIATIIGIIAGFGCVFVGVLSGGGAGMFLNVPSMAITVGGMLSATLIHFSLPQVLRILALIKKTLFCKLLGQNELIQRMVNFAAVNRRDGSLALESRLSEAGDDFLAKGLRMVIDGQNEEAIEKQLQMEIDNLRDRHATGKKILEFMGASAPAFGMIGTLIGLVQMLSELDDPSRIGVGMANALLTTFYGALLANLVFIPLAGKLGMRSEREGMLRQMTVEGLLSIARGESPTVVRTTMQTFLSEKSREDFRPRI